MKQSKFLVFYSVRCTPHVKEFSSLTSARRFVNKFKKEILEDDNEVDNWVDLIIEGKAVQLDRGAKGMVFQ